MSPASRSTLHALRSQRGVALVVTLLLLSIITFMTVTFLVVSRSQKGSVVTATEQTIARLAADTALARAQAELIANIITWTNEFNYGLLVSTNYINSAGFVSGNTSPLNVNYDYKVGGNFTVLDWEQNIANLLYMPRPPVFVVTNRQYPNWNDFRYYLDLNRNGRYETNGFLPVISSDPARPFYNSKDGSLMAAITPGLTVSNFFVGDPEWIGSLERPEFQHSADNRFVNRYAYIAIPAGNTLDLNFIHNEARALARGGALDWIGTSFARDQGVGSWEINLAAFLADLNTNVGPWGSWSAGYTYDPVSPVPASLGTAFSDAASLLGWRYAKSANGLASVFNQFTNGQFVFNNDGIDGYTTAVQLNSAGFPQDPDFFPTSLTKMPWSGSDNPIHFYTTQELFDESKTAPFVAPAALTNTPTFTKRLLAASSGTNSYNRYTYYRLLSQLGTDSATEPAGKLNINYRNVDNNGNVVAGMATNFIPWLPEQFFTNAAIRLLANAGYTAGVGSTNLLYVDNRGVTNLHIQLYPTNLYTPSVHRLLQLAANIYDASTNRTFNIASATNGLPSVFRPLFKLNKIGDQVFITGYQEVQDGNALLNLPVLDPAVRGDRNNIGREPQMLWGIPLVIGAKKGLPNFNKFSMQTQMQVTRKLQFHRPGTSTTEKVNELNQMFVVSITNVFGLQAWNSYASAYPRSLRAVVIPNLTVTLTNLETRRLLNPGKYQFATIAATNIGVGGVNLWPGYNPGSEASSFVVPLASGAGVPYTNCVFLSNATYYAASDTFVPLTGNFERTPGTTNIHVPRWQLNVRTRLRFAIVDTTPGLGPNGRIVDYVNLDATEEPLDLTDALMHDSPDSYPYDPMSTTYTPSATDGAMWTTNRVGGVNNDLVPTFGVMNQIQASLGLTSPDWNQSKNEFPAGMNKASAIEFFKGQFTPGYLRQSNTFAAPYQPFRNVYKLTDWQANDPLVHYTPGDLKNLQSTNRFLVGNPKPADLPINSILQVNQRYEPWGGNPRLGSPVNAPLYDLRVKDPVANVQGHSDHWDFPTNKFPSIGWLGRVHRGTPWQTMYLKSSAIDTNTWMKWSGNGQLVPYVGQFPTNRLPYGSYRANTNGYFVYSDALLTMPTNDWHVLDLFTAAINDNASRGRLSINQSGIAAWSAILSGVVALTNGADASGNSRYDVSGNPVPAPRTIQPAGPYDPFDRTTWSPVAKIVNGINLARANTNVAFPVFPKNAFQSLGDILAVPELSVSSPFVNTNLAGRTDILTDAACERIPQQILGLLQCDHTPRFVVYSFGQTLKPADRSLVTSGAFARLCTNYQIVAEAATRAVLRVEGAPTNSHVVIESFTPLGPD